MSWFREHEGVHLGDLPESICPDEPIGAEIASGVILKRRSFIWTSAATLLGLPVLARAGDKPSDPPSKRREPGGPSAQEDPSKPAGDASLSLDALTFKKFLELAKPLAKKLIAAPEPQEDAYLHQIASLLLRVAPPPKNLFFHALPIVVFQMKLSPKAKI